MNPRQKEIDATEDRLEKSRALKALTMQPGWVVLKTMFEAKIAERVSAILHKDCTYTEAACIRGEVDLLRHLVQIESKNDDLFEKLDQHLSHLRKQAEFRKSRGWDREPVSVATQES